jgi:heme/copper-type cytochrome/quinol oxidase subunit 4
MHSLGLMSVALGFELTFAAGRMFRQEWRWKTLSSLAMLPASLRSVAYQKIIAALFASWPGLLYFCIGLAFAREAIWASLRQALSNSNTAWINPLLVTFGYLIVHLVFFLHLVANLSLRVKWGAVPLAIAISYISLMFIGTGAVLFGGSKGMIVPPLIWIVATVVLHVNTGARLVRLAAEE